MMKKAGVFKVCNRGHEFYKSSDCPVCPVCWPGQMKKLRSDFPEKLSAPALRALNNAKIKSLKELTRYSEKEILGLHGMGLSGIKMLRGAMQKSGLSFRE